MIHGTPYGRRRPSPAMNASAAARFAALSRWSDPDRRRAGLRQLARARAALERKWPNRSARRLHYVSMARRRWQGRDRRSDPKIAALRLMRPRVSSAA